MNTWLEYLPIRNAAISLCINGLKAVGISRSKRACHRDSDETASYTKRKTIYHFELIRQYLPDLTGRIGLEIGPGSNLGVAECCLANGAAEMLCAEQYATVQPNIGLHAEIAKKYGTCWTAPKLVTKPFEEIDTLVDFIYSIDVLEHVKDVRLAIEHMAKILKPGGMCVHTVDFAGHNAYANTGVDFLTCPDWMWSVLHGNLETTNRIRVSELKSAIQASGMQLVRIVAAKTANLERIRKLRPLLNERFVHEPDSDLCVLQGIFVFRKL